MLLPCGLNSDPMAGGLATGAFFAAAPDAGCGGPCGSIGAGTKKSQKGEKCRMNQKKGKNKIKIIMGAKG